MEATIERKPGIYRKMRASYMVGLLGTCMNRFRSRQHWDEDMVHASTYEEENTHLLPQPELLMVNVTALGATGGFVPQMEAVNRRLVDKVLARNSLPALLAALPEADSAELAGDMAVAGIGGLQAPAARPRPGYPIPATPSDRVAATNEWGDVLTFYEQSQAAYMLALWDALRDNLCCSPENRRTRESLHAAVFEAVMAQAGTAPVISLVVHVTALGATGGFVPGLEKRLRLGIGRLLDRPPFTLLESLQPGDREALSYDMRLLDLT